MRSTRLRLPGSLGAGLTLIALGAVAMVLIARGRASTWSEGQPAYEVVALPEGLDSLSSLEEAARRLAACGDHCSEVVYVWSPRMPLSRSGIPNVERASRKVGAGLTLVGFEELERFADGEVAGSPNAVALSEAMLAAGVLAHAPSLVVHDGKGVVGTAVLGYKSADAYEAMIAGRLSSEVVRPPTADPPDVVAFPDEVTAFASARDYLAVGVPGAYFRSVPGRQTLAYESDRRVYLLDLEDGRNRMAPGTIDFIPTPDGRYFVTPGPRSMGLAFFEADRVFDAAREGRVGDVTPVYTDARMRDQYPSIGILREDGESTRYRILTSWFSGLVYRDYEIVHGDGTAPTVEPLGPPLVPCEGSELSTPIMSQDGLEVAARDEASGTTKIFRFLSGGRCEEVLDLGMATRKVAWRSDGQKLAFSTPRVSTAASGGAEPGVFVYDRGERSVTRVADSAGASQLAFPDFVGEDGIVFMIPGRSPGEQSVFRVVQLAP